VANSAYTQWDNLRKALKNSKVGPNGKIATILMDCFIKLDGKLRVPLFRDKGLCQKSGEFYEMRKKLKDKGWLEFDTDANGKLIRYYPGKKLIKYINREKASQFELATKDEIGALAANVELKDLALKGEIEKLNDRMSRAEKAIFALINKYDPPGTIDKLEKALSGGYEEVLN